MKLSDKEFNCMKMCQKAPKCIDCSINPGGACPKTPLPALATYRTRAFMHSVKVCQVHNDPLARLSTICPPPLTWNPGSTPAVLSLQCQTFGIQIRLDVLFGLIWVQPVSKPVSKDYYFAGFTTGIMPNSPRILFD